MDDEYWAQNEAELACLVAAGRDLAIPDTMRNASKVVKVYHQTAYLVET